MRCGVDLVQVSRVAGLLERHPGARQRLFTAGELADAVRDGVAPDDPVALRRLAARFAAKEATVKALGRPRLSWTDIEVVTGDDGAPALRIEGRELPGLSVSLSHDGDFAVAYVVAALGLAEAHDPDELAPATTFDRSDTPTGRISHAARR